MKIEDIVNDVVLVVLDEPGKLSAANIDGDKLYARVRGYDDFGLWIEHPGYEVVTSEDASGKPLPPDRIKREQIDASVLILWKNIKTLVHFPHREGFDFPSPFELHIGFRAGNKTKVEGNDSE